MSAAHTEQVTNECDCHVIITDPHRAERFRGIFDKERIPIKGPMMVNASTGDLKYTAYLMRKDRLTEEQRRKIAERVAPAFGITIEEALGNLQDPAFDIPVRSDDCILWICELHKRMIMADAMEAMLDEEGDEDLYGDDDEDFEEDEEE